MRASGARVTGHALRWLGSPLEARASGALWCPEARLLCVADLHLGRSERLARRGGGLLPPYETAETLGRLADEITALRPATVLCLGDSFDDDACAAGLGEAERRRLTALSAGRDWVWIAGNHDPGPLSLPGAHLAEYRAFGLTFRHAAEPAAEPGEVSGHWHPKLRRGLRGVALNRPCFLWDGARLILPAFGAYTGGLSADHPALASLLGPSAIAILTGTPTIALPLGHLQQRRRARA